MPTCATNHRIWDAINKFVEASGGAASVLNVARQRAVVAVVEAIDRWHQEGIAAERNLREDTEKQLGIATAQVVTAQKELKQARALAATYRDLAVDEGGLMACECVLPWEPQELVSRLDPVLHDEMGHADAATLRAVRQELESK
jgi:hypothetical protein